MEELMIRIDNVAKMYKLGQIGGGTLKGALQSRVAKLRGKEDPTKKIGAKEYNKGDIFMALNGVSFDVKKGERVGIIGHNGAGKSTLLKLLSRVTAPTDGEICLNGRVASMLEVGTGFHGELTGRENIYMNGAILGMTKKEIDSKMDDIIEFSECRKFIDTPVKRYSSGMYVKLAFSVAAHLDSEIMIMDEVLAVGDMAFQKKCLNKMSEVSKNEGRTILYVSHNMNTIRQLCDRVVVLDHGKVVFDGDVEEGISIYLNKAQSEEKTEFELSKMIHVDKECTFDIKMCHLKFIGKIQPIFGDNEKIKMEIQINSKKDMENIVFRATLRYSDEYIIGTSWSNSITIPKGDNQKILVDFPTNCIAPGNYYASIGLYQLEESGNLVMIDHITKAFGFEVQQVPEVGKKIWSPSYWGPSIYPESALTMEEKL